MAGTVKAEAVKVVKIMVVKIMEMERWRGRRRRGGRRPLPRFVCLGTPLATCALPLGVFYLLTYLLTTQPTYVHRRFPQCILQSSRMPPACPGLRARPPGSLLDPLVHSALPTPDSDDRTRRACITLHTG